MGKVWIAILSLVLGLGTTTWWLHRSLSAAQTELGAMVVQAEAQTSRIEALEAQAGRITAGINNLNQRSAEHERRIGNALRQEPDWSATPVPPVVSNELCKFATCADRDPPRPL